MVIPRQDTLSAVAVEHNSLRIANASCIVTALCIENTKSCCILNGTGVGSTILAIDPGGTTGIAYRMPDSSLRTCTVTSPQELWAFFNPKPDIVVFEVFTTGNRVDKYMIYTIELVGGIKAACEILGISGYAHSPQMRKSFIEDARVALRATREPFMIHEVDALAHLLCIEWRIAEGKVR